MLEMVLGGLAITAAMALGFFIAVIEEVRRTKTGFSCSNNPRSKADKKR